MKKKIDIITGTLRPDWLETQIDMLNLPTDDSRDCIRQIVNSFDELKNRKRMFSLCRDLVMNTREGR